MAMLHLRVVEAKGLAKADVGGLSDPYCKIKVIDDAAAKKKHKTRTIGATLHPVWSESFTFNISSPSKGSLVLKVYDKDMIRDDFLGRLVIPLDKITSGGEPKLSGWFYLNDKANKDRARGSVYIELAFDAEGATNAQKSSLSMYRTQKLDEAFADSKEDDVEEKKQTARVFVGTWNVGNEAPQEDLSPWLGRASNYDIVVIGAQECKYKPQASCDENWRKSLQKSLGDEFILAGHNSLWEMRLVVFVKRDFTQHLDQVDAHTEATGIASVLGNKGGVVLSLDLKDTRVCFVNSHLAAHQDKTAKRNDNVREIISGVSVGYKPIDILNQFHHVIWMGDLNYRVEYGTQGDNESPSEEQFNEMVALINDDRIDTLLPGDQLAREMKEGRVFRGFKEGGITFRPTFKVLREKELKYKKQRSPAWCDRVLWKSLTGAENGIRLLEYSASFDIGSSDHKPVFAGFEVDMEQLRCGTRDSLGQCTVQVTNLKASGLQASDANGLSDPFVRFLAPFLPSAGVKTSVVPSTLDPEWADKDVPALKLTINTRNRIAQSYLLVEVNDRDYISSNDVIANGHISLQGLASNDSIDFEIDLTRGGQSAGQLRGTLTAKWG